MKELLLFFFLEKSLWFVDVEKMSAIDKLEVSRVNKLGKLRFNYAESETVAREISNSIEFTDFAVAHANSVVHDEILHSHDEFGNTLSRTYTNTVWQI